ncbi:MAG: competence protein CoiA family protein [Chthoniobacteraceae bacterium]
MPFIALDPVTNERVDATRLDEPLEVARAKSYLCQLPDCKQPMRLRVYSKKRRTHFWHLSGCECASRLEHHPQSREHEEGVFALREWLQKHLASAFTRPIHREVPLMECGRVADLLVAFPCGWRVAFELQLSAITLDALDARIQSYLRSGTDVIWFIGKSADTVAVRDFLASRYGFVPVAHFSDEGGIHPKFGHYHITVWPPKGENQGYEFEATFHHHAHERQGLSWAPPFIEKLTEWFRDAAFLRYFVAWSKGNRERFIRGLTLGDAMLKSFAGRLGSANNRHAWKEKDLWTVDQSYFEHYSSKVPKLDKMAVEAMRTRAKILAEVSSSPRSI